MLSFISFWRAAAIVLADLASSAYYAGGDAEKVIGKSAPWFILAVMLFSYAVRAVYIEASSMFVRGGVYRVVLQAMGDTLAKLSVSALLFDYILTGPISAVTAGQYLAGFIEEVARYLKHPLHFNENYFAAAFGIIAICYFWWKNIEGIHESSDKALWIMKVTTVMVIILIAWCAITVLKTHAQLPPLPRLENMKLDHEFLGWLTGTRLSHIMWIVALVGMGHSVLAMSGEETLAQVNREIESPKLLNLQRAGLVIFVYSLVFTSFVSFLAVMIIPDAVRRTIHVSGWADPGEAALPCLRRARRCSDSLWCCQYGHLGRQWRAQPPLRNARPHFLVSAPSPKVWHNLPDHQSHHPAAGADDCSQPRQLLRAGRPVRVWRRLEFLVQWPRGSHPALQIPGTPRMESAWQPEAWKS